MNYEVELEVYRGPLDLLLYLIQESEIAIYDIPISLILEKYLEHLERMKSLDINLAGEFLVMASTLMEIKSKTLLPAEERPPEEEGDPRADLVRQLLAYRRFKEAASRLSGLAEARSQRYGRGRPLELPGDEDAEGPEPLKEVSLFDVADAYRNLMRQTMSSGPRTILYDEISVEERMEAIMRALESRPELAFQALFIGSTNRLEVVGVFFALLELVRQRMVRIYQNSDFGEVMVVRRAEGEEAAPMSRNRAAGAEEALLPPPSKQALGAGGRPWKGVRRRHFKGLDGAEEEAPVEELDQELDESELRLARRIDAVIKRADEVMQRFEAAKKGKLRPDVPRCGDES